MTSRIIISRTDSIGDVMLTLPLCGILKQLQPGCHIIFLARSYTKPVLECCEHVDEILDWDELSSKNEKGQAEELKAQKANTIIHVFPRKEIAFLSKKAGIKNRIGTIRRWYNLLTCNTLSNYSRKRSNLHESQLNLKLLRSFGYESDLKLDEIPALYGFSKAIPLPEKWKGLLDQNKFNLILHPKSKGSAVEWGIENFQKLVNLLPQDKFNILITGTEEEGKTFTNRFEFPHTMDITGKLTLDELIALISNCDGLLAASTGPLHIASALGKRAIGLYSPRRPIHPGRWAPIGEKAQAIVFDEQCEQCESGVTCDCIQKISPERISNELQRSV